MPTDPGFKDFVLDQLAPLGDVWARAMFGGYGLYADGLFFGLIADDRLFLKTDAETRTAYVERGMQPFQPNAKQTLVSYHEAPPELLDDQERLVAWARQAVAVARATATVKTEGGKARGSRRGLP